uniref:Uncharacterized protein n=1 Tax=Rhizophora mucronata TaxID=61149 RepID=A0A2P2LWC6_RHIMU
MFALVILEILVSFYLPSSTILCAVLFFCEF